MNDCLEKGLTLQYKLWDVLVGSRFHPVILWADIEMAFWKFVFERAREIVLDFIELKLVMIIKLRSLVLLSWCLDLQSHLSY